MDVRVVLDGAARALSSTAGAPVRLAAPELLKSWERNDVWRCRVVDGPSRLPPSVIVKHFKSQPDRGFDDWASLEFLSSLALDPPVAPTFLAGDRAARVFVMADVGPGRTLEDLLLGGDAKAAVEGLVGVATQTARLHAATLQESQVFDRLRDRLASRAVTPMERAVAELRRSGPDLGRWLTAVGLRAPAGLATAGEALARFVEQPGPLVAFTHGDMAPTNTHIAGPRVTLLDFEYGGVRHALYDTLLWDLFCPFPTDLIARADAAYRAELSGGCAAARDDELYDGGRGAVAAWRTVNLLQWLTPSLLAVDQPWAPDMTARQAILYHLERYQSVGTGNDRMAAFVDAFAQLQRALRARWLAEAQTILVWPAFLTEGR